MKYQEIRPGGGLANLVKCFYIYESDVDMAFDDMVFPSGCMEMVFNLGPGQWLTVSDGGYVVNPGIELWGQIVRPLAIRSLGKHVMLGVRFYPHAAACFLEEKVALLNDQVVDARELMGNKMDVLYARLQETEGWQGRVALLEDFLTERLMLSEKRTGKIAVVHGVMKEMGKHDFFDNIENVAARYGITARYLQKVFLQYTGLTPKLYSKIDRFQQSLRLVAKKDVSLTAIAYDCGYFDQSHFIREFKSFTGLTPSGYSIESSPVTLALANQ